MTTAERPVSPSAAGDEFTRLAAQLVIERERGRRLEAQIRNLADRDRVTGLLHHDNVEQELEEHLARCDRYGPEGAFLLIGIDGLDDVGAAVGRRGSNEVLATVAERVAARLRSTDVLGRWDRDELTVLLPKEAASGTAIVAEVLVGLVSSTGTPEVPQGSLTASIGVAPVIATPVGARQLVARARQAMETARRRSGGGWAALG